MASRRKTPYPEPTWIDPKLSGMQPDVAQGAMCVPHLNRVAVARPETVLQHERRHAEGIQPARDLLAFVIDCEMAVSATGKHDDSGSVRAIARDVDVECGLIGLLVALCPRRSIGPKQNDFRFGRPALGRQWNYR